MFDKKKKKGENRSNANFQWDKFNQQTFCFAVLKIYQTTECCWVELSSQLGILYTPGFARG